MYLLFNHMNLASPLPPKFKGGGELREYPIYKKRDGQSFEEVSSIHETSFDKAKKVFALNMTKDNADKSNNIIWLDKDNDGVQETGWYDDDSVIEPVYKADGEEIDYSKTEIELFASESDINEGFETWREDVYTWELRQPVMEDEDED